MGLFGRSARKTRLSHINNLISIAAADGHFDEKERDLIYAIADRMGVTAEEVTDVMIDPSEIDFHVPDSDDEKLELVFDLIQLMMINGSMDEEEKALCTKHIGEFGFNARVTAVLIEDAVDSLAIDAGRMASLHKLKKVLRSN